MEIALFDWRSKQDVLIPCPEDISQIIDECMSVSGSQQTYHNHITCILYMEDETATIWEQFLNQQNYKVQKKCQDKTPVFFTGIIISDRIPDATTRKAITASSQYRQIQEYNPNTRAIHNYNNNSNLSVYLKKIRKC